ncbi:hypothetical protein DA2_1197 [Desulfovibrio sp. A2]|nr:hypothetical protein DA2_1197 [Desulfovibrio sp. A2]
MVVTPGWASPAKGAGWPAPATRIPPRAAPRTGQNPAGLQKH